MVSRRCAGGDVLDRLSQDDLMKLNGAREAGIGWPQIALALRSSGWREVTAYSLGRHYRGACACERVREREAMLTVLDFGAPPEK